MRYAKTFAAVMLALLMAFLPAVCAAGSSSAEEQHYSGTDEIFSRGFVTHIDSVCYDEHQDRTNVYFFVPGSENEIKFLKYVGGESSEYPASDDRGSLAGQICNIYSIDADRPRWNNIIRTMDSVSFHVPKGVFISISMTGDSGEFFIIMKNGESTHETSIWQYGSVYPTTSSEEMDITVLPNNPSYSGGNVTLADLFTTVSYSIDVTTSPPNYGGNTAFAVVLYAIAAVAVAVIALSIRNPEWAKVPKDKRSKKDAPSDKGEE